MSTSPSREAGSRLRVRTEPTGGRGETFLCIPVPAAEPLVYLRQIAAMPGLITTMFMALVRLWPRPIVPFRRLVSERFSQEVRRPTGLQYAERMLDCFPALAHGVLVCIKAAALLRAGAHAPIAESAALALSCTWIRANNSGRLRSSSAAFSCRLPHSRSDTKALASRTKIDKVLLTEAPVRLGSRRLRLLLIHMLVHNVSTASDSLA